MKSLKAQVYVAVVCIVLGLMLAYQFRAVKNISNIAVSQKVMDITKELNETKKQKEDLDKNIRELENKISEYEQNAADRDAMANSLKNELDRVRIIAGLTKVEGPGITIKVIPQTMSIDSKEPSPVSFVHLLLVINELNASGAEAVMVNNQRIVSTTQIRDAGSMIIINGVRFSSIEEFEIKAIGDPDTLEAAINLPGGVKQELSYYNINIVTQKSDNVVVFKYNKIIEQKFAKPAKEGE